MMLSDYSEDQLINEINSRKKNKIIGEPQSNIDWLPVIKYITESFQSFKDSGHEPKDFEHYIFEEVMEAVYGKDFWKWYNNLFD